MMAHGTMLHADMEPTLTYPSVFFGLLSFYTCWTQHDMDMTLIFEASVLPSRILIFHAHEYLHMCSHCLCEGFYMMQPQFIMWRTRVMSLLHKTSSLKFMSCII